MNKKGDAPARSTQRQPFYPHAGQTSQDAHLASSLCVYLPKKQSSKKIAGSILAFAIITGSILAFGAQAPASAAPTGNTSPLVPHANGPVNMASFSANARYVVFTSAASNLVPGDTNNSWDIFLQDRRSGAITLISKGADGSPANGDSEDPAISANGNRIVFTSTAYNLVPGDTPRQDIFMWERATGQTTLVSKGMHDTPGTRESWWPEISSNGRYVTFMSFASNLVPSDTNNAYDIFLWDSRTGNLRRINLGRGGTQANAHSWAPSISGNGQYIAYESLASNLVPGDENRKWDVFLVNTTTGATRRVSAASGGGSGNGDSGVPSISANGQFVAFYSNSSNIAGGRAGKFDVFLWERSTARSTLISKSITSTPSRGNSILPVISQDGQRIAFHSESPDLVTGDNDLRWDIFLWERSSGEIVRVSPPSTSRPAPRNEERAGISGNGRAVAYYDTNRSGQKTIGIWSE